MILSGESLFLLLVSIVENRCAEFMFFALCAALFACVAMRLSMFSSWSVAIWAVASTYLTELVTMLLSAYLICPAVSLWVDSSRHWFVSFSVASSPIF